MTNFQLNPSATAIIISTLSPTSSEADFRQSTAELESLLGSLGIQVSAVVSQRRSESRSPHVLGSGKLDEVRELLARYPAECDVVVVCNGGLSPGQQRHLARELGVEVLDRTQVILQVFAQRARTRTAQLEIELARIRYELPRLRDAPTLIARQSGGGGRGEQGNTSVELRKQLLKKRAAMAQQELAQSLDERSARAKRRQALSRVALVGYTNAGKSTWMRALTGAQVTVRDALFATLDTTVRHLHPPTLQPILVADTVGFLRNLPNALLASFQSTLCEALDAQLLLVVVDASDPNWESQLATTNEVLQRVGAAATPRILLMNKSDRLSYSERLTLSEEQPNCLCVSAYASADVARVHQRIASFISPGFSDIELLVPFEQAKLRAHIWREAQVLAERSDASGTHMTIRATPELLRTWQSQLQGPTEESGFQ